MAVFEMQVGNVQNFHYRLPISNISVTNIYTFRRKRKEKFQVFLNNISIFFSMLEINKIYNMDCLEGMKEIPDKSIDMILCDLPYGITACEWDKVIPLDLLWIQYKRVIKNNGAIVLTASQPFTTDLINSNRKWFRYEWIWEKNIQTGFLDSNRKPMKKHENILIFSSKNSKYNPQTTKGKPSYRVKKGRSNLSITKDKNILKGGYISINSGCRYPNSILKINTQKGLHPTQKPVALFEYLIKTYTNEGDLILDNCMGSGTTAIACINTKRNYIGFELDKQYFDMANARIDNTLKGFNDKNLIRERHEKEAGQINLF